MKPKRNNIPDISTEDMREVDRLMIEEFGIDLVRMMENAGRNLAVLSKEMLSDEYREKKVSIVVGSGNNGGGGLVAARYLHNWGSNVTVFIENRIMTGIPQDQLKIVEKLNIEIVDKDAAIVAFRAQNADLIIDSLIGYGLKGDPKGWAAKMIMIINDKRTVLSLDAPSGLDTTSGEVKDPCVYADSTMTLALPKTGLLTSQAKKVVGKLYLADIGVPGELYKMMGINIGPIFIRDTIIEL